MEIPPLDSWDNFDTNTDFDEVNVQNDFFSDSRSLACAVNWDDVSAPYMSPLDSESTFIDYGSDGFVVPAGPVGQWKEKLANVFDQPQYDVSISAFILLSSFLVALSTLNWWSPSTTYGIITLQTILGVVLAVDFLGRWFSSSKEFGRFVLSPQFVVDMVVIILPLMVILLNSVVVVDANTQSTASSLIPPMLSLNTSGFFNLQLLRLLRLRRFLKDAQSFRTFEMTLGIQFPIIGKGIDRDEDGIPDWQLKLARVFLTLFTLVSIATGLIYTVEHSVNPDIDSYFDALYFGLTTVTTVGFGDIRPVTTNGRIIVCASILVGVAVVPTQLAELAEALLSVRRKTESSHQNRQQLQQGAKATVVDGLTLQTDNICQNCGTTFHWSSANFCYACGESLR